jgi:formate dehydrogenase subunit gamma
MHTGWNRALAVTLLAAGLWGAGGPAGAQGTAASPAAPAAASASAATALAEPRPDDSNAQRSRSQPGNNAPFWRGVRESGTAEGVVNLPGRELGVLVQPFTRYPGSQLATSGEAWRQVRNQWILPYGAALLFISVLALALFYWRRGTLGEAGGGAPRVERFTPFERAAHWTNAGAFVVLATSGLVMAFGKFLLLPVLGSTLFGWLTYALKTAHNLVGPLFAVSLLVVIATFIKDNLPRVADLAWLRQGGGLFNGAHVPSHRFNAGEKAVFWGGVLGCGLVVVASGLVLDKLVPGMEYLRGNMQVAHMVHALAALLMMAVLVGHIYMGTLGVKGALGAMKTGWVDEAWAREHHELWYNDIQAGRLPAQRSAAAPPLPTAGHTANA